MNVQRHMTATARTDAEDRVIEADGRLASLNASCGGAVGETLAIPELLGLVGKARQYGLKLSRQFRAVEGDASLMAWAEITPISGEDGGAEISVSNWQSSDAPIRNEEDDLQRIAEIDRYLAECTAHLDPQQRVLSIDTDAEDLAEFARTMRANFGKPWTDFVEVSGHSHAQPMQWRLLDGAKCTVPGSKREWSAHLDPLGKPEPGSGGFVLYLTASRPLSAPDSAAPAKTPSLGRELTPVLRQPINRIIANAETIRTKLAGPLADEYADYAGDIAGAAQHLLALIDDLSDLEVVEAEDFSTAPDKIDLADVARRACGILGVRAAEKRIRLEPPPAGETQAATAEFRRVLQVLLNLVGNAIRYSPEDSQVWVRLDRVGERAMVTVADQGHGLDEDQQRKVFEKFERLGKHGDGGSGLGLYISRRIARAMGGDLTVESAPGQGARFTLSVPIDETLPSR